MAELDFCRHCETLLNLETDVERYENMSTCKKCGQPLHATEKPQPAYVIKEYRKNLV